MRSGTPRSVISITSRCSDLAKATGADAPNSLPGLAYPYTLDGYTTPWNDQQHVNYVGRDGKVHELWYSDGGGWKHNILNDLAKATGADDQNSLSANADYTLDGYTTPWNDQQHVNYIAQDGKVHELLYTDSRGWQHDILSDLAKATGADDQNSLPAREGEAAATGIDGYVT
jgi:hypothetical protein